MIPFFRKIRKTLADDNKPIKYLRYAIGEIVLVVIGILIALQINNWNETNKLKKEEQKLLISLNDDFKENNLRLQQTIKKQEDVVRYSKELIKAMLSNNKNIDPDSIGQMVTSGAQSWYRAEYVTGTYDGILSSGNINILNNENLKRNLAQFSSEVKSGFEDHEESMGYMLEFNKLSAPFSHNLMKLQVYNDLDIVINVNTIQKAVDEIISNKVYLGLLIDKTIVENHRLIYQNKIQNYIKETLAIIESELRK
ncbi:DUF6090 family protein [Gaetbulibacter aquiaggeris]|uniref:DUF6090 family protein n=1 Tax=Gaetbulibacter aquiaggeris TaxID=1735373 RepID=A0ABW7MTW9_9FLAO